MATPARRLFRPLPSPWVGGEGRAGTPYPAVLLTVGLSDARVPAWQGGKMAAALQAATSSGRPVLLRVDAAAGHIPGAFTEDQLVRMLSDVYAFAIAVSGTHLHP